MTQTPMPETPAATKCLECERTLGPEDDRELTEKGVFCRDCFQRLATELNRIVAQQSENINWSAAAAGALGGAVVGVLAWWGVTVITKYNIGLAAIVIGIAVAKGILLATGGKRSAQLQVLSVGVSVLAFFYANYLVVRTFTLQELPEWAAYMTLFPAFSLFYEVTVNSLNGFTLVFLAIVVWEAWRYVKPLRL